jgi:type IX secretion system PorP/SprF family membrane protein
MKTVINYIVLLCMALILPMGKLAAQDPQFSQFYMAPLYLNPAFAGTAPEHRVNLNSRIQWPNLPRAYQTVAASYDYNLEHLNSGFGLLAFADRAGSGNLINSTASFIYSFKAALSKRWVLTSGLNFTYASRSLGRDGLIMPDQIAANRDVSFDDELNNIQNVNHFDFGSGLLLYSERIWVGLAIDHIVRPNISMVGDENLLPIKYSFHAGIRIPLYDGPKKFERISSIAPSFLYKQQGVFNQLDVGFNWHYNPISAGLWYRGLHVTNEGDDSFTRDALIFIFGLTLPDFDVNYSYDFTVSGLGADSGGAHEISLIFNFEVKLKKKRKEKFIPCPTF